MEIQALQINTDNRWLQMKEASKKIAPLWPLENFVAVNPYLGYTDKEFFDAAVELQGVGDIKMTMPIDYYLSKIDKNVILNEDIKAALKAKGIEKSVSSFIQELKAFPASEPKHTVYAFVDIASTVTETDWNRFMVNRISSWAASYFDKGQALWQTSTQELDTYKSWKQEASFDRTPDFSGLKGFREEVRKLPNDKHKALMYALDVLGFGSDDDLTVYFHRLLRIMGGWSAYQAYLDWEDQLEGKDQDHLMQFLIVLLCWEACFLRSVGDEALHDKWRINRHALTNDALFTVPRQQLMQHIVLQDAFDRAEQRRIIKQFQGNRQQPISNKKYRAQAVFCIDVRSEVYRRNLEAVNGDIETLGFAGFFGFPVNYQPIGSSKSEAQYPALIKPGLTVKEVLSDVASTDRFSSKRKADAGFKKAWSSFKQGAISCFGFVSPLGLSFLPKIFSDTFGWSRPGVDPKEFGLSKKHRREKTVDLNEKIEDNIQTGISLEQQVEMAKNALTAMSLTENFARYVLIVGHGSTSVNNPHATGLDCGACGGHSGDANAKVAAKVLNHPGVRDELKLFGIHIPNETTFLAALHDTTTDEVKILNSHDLPESERDDFLDIQMSLDTAGILTRTERSLKMSMDRNRDVDPQILKRSRDWSQVRPEWGLAGCSAFVIAPRSHTSQINLNGKSFLHTYEWRKDKSFKVLEQIMTAPMVVTSWINLQYYGSSVDNDNLGSGNKTLHNVTSGLGVIEGASGDIRTGLAYQSVHDGKMLQHEPNRLNVIIEAPKEAINEILKKHEGIKNLIDNQWISLLTLNDLGQVNHRYVRDLDWETVE